MSEKKKLFGNVGGNQFRLLTEGMDVTTDKPQGTEHIREGLKKVLANGGREISYKRLQNVGYGYIKDITIAAKCAIHEARELAKDFGYKDDQNNAKFVKENDIEHEPYIPGENKDEKDMSNPAEKREVQIGKSIISICDAYIGSSEDEAMDADMKEIRKFALELIKIHGQR
jgi:hypothetical protein